MVTLLKEKLWRVKEFLKQGPLAPEMFGLTYPINNFKITRMKHGDHNLILQLELTDNRGGFFRRCLRVDLGNSACYKEKEHQILKIAGEYGLGPKVYGLIEEPPLLVLEWIEKVKGFPGRFSPKRKDFLKDTALLYQRLHGVMVNDDGLSPGERYQDFIAALRVNYDKLPQITEPQRELFGCLPQGNVAPKVKSRPVITQLSPKKGNLVLRDNTPFFIDWDTARITDKERDIAVFIGVNLHSPAEVRLFLDCLQGYNRELIGLYLLPVVLWSSIRRGYRLTPKRVKFLRNIAAGLA